MTALPSLSIRLVHGRAGASEAWPLGLLASHLEAAGHRVETSDPTSAAATTADVVHCFGLSTARDLSVEEVTAPLVVTPSSSDAVADEPVDRDPLLVSSASAVVRSSSEQAQVHRLGVPWFRTWVLPVAVDVGTFTRLGPMANRTERFRLVVELSGPDDGLEDVLVAVAKLDEAELVVLVDGPDAARAVANRAAAVRAAALEIGLSDRVVVVVPASAGQRAWWLRSAHVAIAVPHAPLAGDFVAEAMACGTPVVATPVGALADLVVHGITGFHVPVGDPLSVARAVRLVLEDDFTVESYGMAAADRALSRFAWPRVVHELVGVYRRVTVTGRDHDEETEDEAELDVIEVPVLPEDVDRIA